MVKGKEKSLQTKKGEVFFSERKKRESTMVNKD